MPSSNSERWYHVQNPGGGGRWVPSSDVACMRPTVSPPPRPQQTGDSDVPPLAECASVQTTGSRTFASGECQR